MANSDQPGTSSTFNLRFNWVQIFSEKLSACNVDEAGKEWILSNFANWENLEQLDKCEDISRKKLRQVKEALFEEFVDFLEQKRAFAKFIDSLELNLNKKLEEQLFICFANGYGELLQLFESDEIDRNVPKEKIESLKSTLENDRPIKMQPSINTAEAGNIHSLMGQMEEALKTESIKQEAIQEILKNICHFDHLRECLENCEELSKKEVRKLSQTLLELFSKIKQLERPKKQDSSITILQCMLDSLQLSRDANQWINGWLQTNELENLNVDELDACDDLTRKQCQAIKSKLRELTEKTHCSKTVPPSDIFLEQVEKVLKSRSTIKKDVRCWILENICSMQTLDELHNANLGKDEIEFIKLALKEHFYTFRQKEPGFFSNFVCDGSREFLNTTPQHLSDSPERGKTFTITPLIQIRNRIQDEAPVEKLFVSEEGVRNICDRVPERLLGEVPVFYESQSNGTVIDFVTLNKVTFRCIGLFGPWGAVIEGLRPLICTELLQDVQNQFAKLISGLYLIDFTCLTIKFIVFRCSDDTDFATVEKESRAVHLLRYMSQLVNNTVLCLDGKYEDRLSSEREKSDFRNDRRSRFTLKSDETHEETFKLTLLGYMARHPLATKFYSSNSGLLAVSVVKPVSEIVDCIESETGNVSELKKTFELLAIENPDKVSYEFKNDLLKIVHETLHSEIKTSVENEVNLTQEKVEHEIQELVLKSAVLYVIQEETKNSWEWSIVKSFFAYYGDKPDNLWDKKIKLRHADIKTMLSTKNEQILRDAIREQSTVKEDLLKSVLCWYLNYPISATEVSEQNFDNKSCDELWNLVELKVQNDCNIPPGFRDIQTPIVTLSSYYYSHEKSDRVQSCIESYFNYCQGVLEQFRDEPRFTTFCTTKSNPVLEKERQKLIEKYISQKFRELYIGNPKRERGNGNGCLVSIRNLKKDQNGNMTFKLIYKIKKNAETKKFIIHQLLAAGSLSKQKLTTPERKLNTKELEWIEKGIIECERDEELFAMYSLQESKVIVILNTQARSRVMANDLSSTQQPNCLIDFGKKISRSDLDTESRILIVQSDAEPGVVQVVKFTKNYKNGRFAQQVDIGSMFNLEKMVPFCFQRSSEKYLWFLNEGHLRKIDVNARNLSGKIVHVDTPQEHCELRCSPDGAVVFVLAPGGRIVPVMTESGNVMQEIVVTEKEIFVTCISNFALLVGVCEKTLSFHQVSSTTGSQCGTRLLKEDSSTVPQNHNDQKQRSHWINLLYWMYTKFPTEDLLSAHQNETHFWFMVSASSVSYQQKLKTEIKSLQSRLSITCKPFNGVSFHREKIYFSLSGLNDCIFEQIFLGCFLQKLITFVPLQVARCQSNEFRILAKEDKLDLESVSHVFDLAERISLGFFDSIFNSWSGSIKVISSMGKQSTGKSYTLNHLTGSSFNIAGVRCTDGCWMTVKQTDDCLYVILDFEGLGSFERTEQEDMLLSLFNSSIASITLFKTEKRLDRDIDKLFNKMNLGSDQLKTSNQCFRGKFMIVINDVAEHDVVDTPSEFEEKVGIIVTRNENNFIKKLYNSDFEIMAFPAFESKEYYEAIKKLHCIIKDEVKSNFSSGPQFLRTFKLLMAKLAVNDFTPLDRQQIDERTLYLKSLLPEALHYGQTIIPEGNKQKEFDLSCLDDLTLKIPLKKKVKFDPLDSVEISDFQIMFKPNQLDCILALFYEYLDLKTDNIPKWRNGLQNFVLACIDVRFERVQMWIEMNLEKWRNVGAEYHNSIGSLLEDLKSKKVQFSETYRFCEEKCSRCLLNCTLIVQHKEPHTCGTKHICIAKCDFCIDIATNCTMAFGHSGKHACSKESHTCGEKCRFHVTSGCVGKCQKEMGHAGEHTCPESRHPCTKICSLEGCRGRCIINCEFEHTIHKCFQDQCTETCSVPKCENKCAALDHFHGHKYSSTFANEQQLKREPPFLLTDGRTRFNCDEHFCGLEHQCSENCQEPGFCKTITEKTMRNETFIGKRDKFKYGLKFKEFGQKSKCRKKIKLFEREHEGNHDCLSEIHICTNTCPTCENICEKPFGHELHGKGRDQKLHRVRHGNMRKQFFVANQDDIQIGSHKYKVGEPAVAEMCHIFCNTLGRGHIHVVECESRNPSRCPHKAQDGRRHQTVTYHPNPQIPKDEMTHKAYWESICFHDPCQEIDKDEFGKCPAFCAAEVHENEDEESLCDLPLWHTPADSLSDGHRATGYVSKDGHIFPCSHPNQTYHFVLCLDDSMSMSGHPWYSLVDAVVNFVKQRLKISLRDMISIIIHNTRPRVAAEYQPIYEFSKNWLKFRGGGNDFSAALWEADYIIGNHLHRNEHPVLIFMSDGSCRNGEIEMYEICQR